MCLISSLGLGFLFSLCFSGFQSYVTYKDSFCAFSQDSDSWPAKGSGSQLPVRISFSAGLQQFISIYSLRRLYEFRSRTMSEEY